VEVFGFWFAQGEAFGDLCALGVEFIDFGLQRAGRGFA
jgi:hypothetical protein